MKFIIRLLSVWSHKSLVLEFQCILLEKHVEEVSIITKKKPKLQNCFWKENLWAEACYLYICKPEIVR